MNSESSRRNFLAAGLGLPAAALASSATTASPAPAQAEAPPAKPKLTWRTLGKTGLKVTSVSFGCMTTSDPTVIQHAADIGIVHFDTARAYQNGNNERMVGVALKGRRQQVILSSKTLGPTKQEALADLDTSLRELGTDYLDIWYLHAKLNPEEVKDDLLEAQRVAKQQGKIRFAGVSTHFNMDRMLPYLVKLGQTDVVLTTYNFAMQSVEEASNANPSAPKSDMTAAIRQAREAGMGIVTMKALAGGVKRVAVGDRLYGADQRELTRRLSQPGVPAAAIRWVLRNESVDTAIVCMADHDQLQENITAMAEPFSRQDERLLSEHLASIGSTYCRMCGSCNGVCDKGVPVPEVLRYLTYAEGYGQFPMAREKFLGLPEPVRAIRCTDCASCSIHCPNGVAVRERVALAQELFA
ncbi:MAG TPA: aldo/keto reductase [Bryobacteraceae bacterium]|nr:aldo/keto reductase [Bryobacteraceae bacterium]